LPTWLKDWRGDGIIARVDSPQIAAALRRTRLPVVDVSAERFSSEFSRVSIDNDAVARLAAEHLELAVDDDRAERLFNLVRHAGSVFLGRMTPEAIGDYVAGPNHVLPTGRRARCASGLSVLDFMKRTSFIALDQHAINSIGPAAATLADAEGLPAHAASVRKRL
jgi:histidinol dehydrogenase